MNNGPSLATTSAQAGPYLASRLRTLSTRLQEVADRLLGPARDPEAVHDLRVTLRRTRTLLGVGRRVFGPFHAGEVSDALRELQQATGVLRDSEVLLDLVQRLDVHRADVQRWIDSRRLYERRLRRALVRSVQRGQLERGRQMLQALLAFRVNPAREKRLSKFARAAVEEARRGVDRRRAGSSDDSDSLHRLRVAYKRLRYTVEALVEALPGGSEALAHSAARFQNRLGAIHDVDVAAGFVRRARLLSSEAKTALCDALMRRRNGLKAAYAKELAASLAGPPHHAMGTDSLRKSSTR